MITDKTELGSIVDELADLLVTGEVEVQEDPGPGRPVLLLPSRLWYRWVAVHAGDDHEHEGTGRDHQ